ncbi:MAG: response regulator transcription factor [Pseudomonadota bacterium]
MSVDGGESQFIDEAPHVLLVDDDHRIRTLLERFLRARDFRVTTAQDAAEARRKLSSLVFDAIVLDIMMPGEDGLSLLGHLKERQAVPVLLLSAKAAPDERIAGLESGADDYLTKPFEPRELALRLTNLLKRQPETNKTVHFGGFTFDVRREELTKDGAPVRLTDRERRLLRLFAARPGATIARHELVADEDLGDRAIDVQINRLRRKLEEDPADPKYLQTMRGQGYRLLADPAGSR